MRFFESEFLTELTHQSCHSGKLWLVNAPYANANAFAISDNQVVDRDTKRVLNVLILSPTYHPQQV